MTRTPGDAPAALASSPAVVTRARGPSLVRLLFDLARSHRDPLARHLAWGRTYGDVVVLPMRRPQTLQLNGPEDIKHVLVTNSRNYRKTGWLVGGPDFLGEGLLTSLEPLHTQRRAIMKPGFRRQPVPSYAGIIVDAVDECTGQWTPGSVVNISHEMARLALVSIGRTLLGTDLHGVVDDLIEAFTVCQRFMMRWTPLLMARVPGGLGRRYAAAVARIDAVVFDLIAGRRSSASSEDVLSLLLSHRDEQGCGLSDRAIRDEIVTLLWAGHETTGNALEWTWYLLSQHGDVRARLVEEIDSVLGLRRPTAEDLPRLEYADWVFSETLRLYPPAWVLGRWAIDDDELDSGCRVPRGTQVFIAPYVVHRDPRHFPDPERFDPDRFRPEARIGRPPFAYFPFGGGSRVCIGEHYGRLQGVLTLVRIAQQWTLTLVPQRPMAAKPLLTLRPAQDIVMRAARRT